MASKKYVAFCHKNEPIPSKGISISNSRQMSIQCKSSQMSILVQIVIIHYFLVHNCLFLRYLHFFY